MCAGQVVIRTNHAPAAGSEHASDVGSKTTHRLLSRLWAEVLALPPEKWGARARASLAHAFAYRATRRALLRD
eukprot:6681619-Pyramimonas_sp.AAC.1